jgi:DNA-directed RNA polymerase specialized sigma24 family protein
MVQRVAYGAMADVWHVARTAMRDWALRIATAHMARWCSKQQARDGSVRGMDTSHAIRMPRER